MAKDAGLPFDPFKMFPQKLRFLALENQFCTFEAVLVTFKKNIHTQWSKMCSNVHLRKNNKLSKL
jgi:hypothetical protein